MVVTKSSFEPERITLVWRDVAPGPGPAINTSITEKETAELQRLAKDADVLEIGSAYGYSAIAMALAGGRVTAVDPHTGHNSYGTMHANLAVYGVSDRVEVICGRSQDVLPQLAAEGRRFDLVFIDGDHTADVVEHDVRWARRLLRPETGVIACHDYNEITCPGVRVALDKLFGGPGELTDTLTVYAGFGDAWTRRHFRDCSLVTTHHLTCTCGHQFIVGEDGPELTTFKSPGKVTAP